ncbi:quinoprotein dehydrogenase-associated SoxYZ-like carrier [Methylobacterium sp. Leaf399]|uniref:quinoprotein dehydrogenase-associated SoxYZ-like carrier n=1 Tax=unclassified Methylobacterium TaxID=2615210 RepID=UPI0006F1DDB6|nr:MULTISPECIES: quinoprotein dehydrogenase-associated SoxYZ-like carrier [unclassified Methylobacterium]KQP52709.1 quinoprotein dehydrogenase-associated SoxYZ-like carrier [Methylobacterium sp. Leaf108]KQT11890.1 quinoprotein dehydrogenase-associated SoxYZ-like carrier [Methylobacterium sp. Leaf399]KQT84426.1 quinoprotein dehydrogenase-associated SoxYZ-like carrier [Methylobacterium sp. Leaf466]
MKHLAARRLALAIGLSVPVLAGIAAAGPVLALGAGDDDSERLARWKEIQTTIFGDRKVESTDTLVSIDAPGRAMDASLVPITLSMPQKDKIAGLHLVIDDNPSPYAAKFTFGPAADPSEIKLRVRVNNYTNVHAVAETKDGKLMEAVRFVKASGGCSAPMGMSDEEAMKGMGDMRMKFAGEANPGKSLEATLMIRHPNFSGMQMNQVTRDYTPARYITKVEVSRGSSRIFTLDGDISIASNPVIGFSFIPEGQEPIRVVAVDNQNGRWEHSFTAPTASN